MVRPKLRSSGQPWPVQVFFALVEGLSSLYLAVLVIGLSALVLAWATFIESWYGTEAVRFAIYGTWWFKALLGLLGLNVFCAAAVRFPWKRYQTGFVITHTGIIVLLLGCLLSARGGIDARLPVFEGQAAHVAFEDTQHFTLTVESDRASAPSAATSIEVPFASGPFNWEDFDRRLSWAPWRLARRDRGTVYDRDGVKLEVIDYWSNAALEPAPPLRLRVADVAAANSEGQWTTVELEAGRGDPHGTQADMGFRNRQVLSGGQRVIFWIAGSRAETEAFLHSRPQGPLGKMGQVVLYARGKPFPLSVDDLERRRQAAAKAGSAAEARVPLGSTGLDVELVESLVLSGKLVGVKLGIRSHAEPDARPPRQIALFAEVPELNQQNRDEEIFGAFWLPSPERAKAGDEAEPAGARDQFAGPRIDILQSASGKLYYRAWNSPQVDAIGPIPGGRAKVTVFSATANPLSFYVDGFVPQVRPGFVLRPAAFTKGDRGPKHRIARVRLTVDGRAEEFPLEGTDDRPFPGSPLVAQERSVAGRGRRVKAALGWDQVDLGFNVYLHRFQRKLDPGSSQPSHYSSLVDFLDRGVADKEIDTVVSGQREKGRLAQDVLITLNEPVTFMDPLVRRSYRIYQESFAGPMRPGDPIFDMLAGGRVLPREKAPRDELFLSWLSVNYDPGRGLKYAGCLLVVAGIATMFYMRAYFFRPRSRGH